MAKTKVIQMNGETSGCTRGSHKERRSVTVNTTKLTEAARKAMRTDARKNPNHSSDWVVTK